MSGSRTGRRGRYASFADVAARAVPEMPEVGRLVVDLRIGGDVLRIDASGWPCPRLSRLLVEALRREAVDKDLGVRTIRALVSSLRGFVGFVGRVAGPAAGLAELDVSHIELFEKELGAGNAEGSGKTARSRLSHVIRLLRLLHEDNPAGFSDTLADRITYISAAEQTPPDRPLDAYPPKVFEAIKNAAIADVRAIQRRIQASEELARRGRDPRVKTLRSDPPPARWLSGWSQIENVLWLINREGALGFSQWPCNARALWGGLQQVNSKLYLTSGDMVPFIVLLACLTGMEPECLRGLRRDCLSSPARGFVTVSYVKRRSNSARVTKSMRVQDGGGLQHPGGVIRLLLRLTERAHWDTGWDDLWISYSQRGLVRPFDGKNSSTNAWGHVDDWQRRHRLGELKDADGKPVRLDLRRIRKTVKSQQYLKAAGVLADFAQGHSQQVAASHYADIPIHDDVHDLAVQQGLQAALQVALPAPVVVDDDGTVLSEDAEAVPAQAVVQALSGASDVFLASCRDFHDTPFAAKGKPCPVPLWGCVECPNAVFTTRHLPQLLLFVDFVEAQREELTAGEWTLRYGTAWERIIRGVRSKFRPEQVALARAIAESGGARLVLPPEFFEGIA